MTQLRSLVLLYLLALCSQPALAQYQLYDNLYNSKTGTSLKVTAMSETLPSSGYMAVRVNARNGEKVPLKWNFNFTSKDHSWSESNELSSSFSLSCSAGRQKSVEFLVPLVTAIHPDSPLLLALSISGRPPLYGAQVEMQSEQIHSWPAILMSEALDIPNSGPLDSAVPSSSSYGGSSDFAGKFLPRDLTDDWRGYVGFDIMMLTSEDWKDVSPGAKTAILKWNRLGGRLIFYGSSDSVDLSTLGIPAEGKNKRNTKRSWGKVEILKLPAKSLLPPSRTASLIKKSPLAPRATISGNELVSNWPLQQLFGERTFNPVFFILILIAFGIIVGPINLFVFAKSGQRHRLFITTPMISLSASALLLLIILFQDGFGGKGQRLALIEIQPEENTAYIEQQQIARTGVLLKTSFPSKENAIVSPVTLDHSRWARITPRNQGGASRYRITPEEKNTLSLTGDWYKSRSEYGHLVTSIQSTRGRLELLSASGQPTITSTFDYPLKKVYYLDSSGGIWQNSSSLKSGRKTQLSLCPKTDFDSWLTKQGKKLNPNSKKRLDLVSRRKGHFIAIAEEGPFIDTLASLSWQESTAIITGPIVTP